MSHAISISQPSFRLPESAIDASPEIQILIQDVARKCLIELAISLSIGAAAACFTATLLHGSLIFAAIAVQTVCNAALRIAAALASRMPPCKETQWIQTASPYLCMTMFAYLTAYNAQILLHEAGHAIASKAMFQNANPQISFTPCIGGSTEFSQGCLAPLGEKIGKNNAMLFVTLMGPTCTLLISTLAIAVGYAIQNKFPELGYYLIGIGRGDFLAHSFYALTACSTTPGSPAHDFIQLQSYGIHPLAAAISIFAIPILLDRAFERKC
jgi:hypothetical protein